jgi:1-acyl-sn-glycerol-3-phosphate acyltransferase
MPIVGSVRARLQQPAERDGSERHRRQRNRFKLDPDLTKRTMRLAGPIIKRYYRPEVHGLELLPPGGVLVVPNHSGGFLDMDEAVFAVDYYDKFGYARPIYALTHDIMLVGPTVESLRRMGYIRATRANAAEALRASAVVIDFPGGDYDAYRPTWSRNTVDFCGRTGYARTAIDGGRHLAHARPSARQAAAFQDPANHVRFPFRAEHCGVGQHAVTHQDRHPEAGTGRHRRAVRCASRCR